MNKTSRTASASILGVLLAIVLFAIIALIILNSRCNMAFRNTYVLSGVATDSVQTVPAVLRQTWKTSDIPDRNRPWVESWSRGLPGFEKVLETDATIDAFVASEFPYYLPVWNRLTPFIKKIDTVRYMWMLRHGGVYTDLDTTLHDGPALQALLKAKLEPPVAFIPAAHSTPVLNRDAASPAFLGSQPGHPIWIFVLQYIARNGWNPAVKVATGPIALTNVLKEWVDSGRTESIVLMSESLLGIGWMKDSPFIKHYIRHHNTKAWDNGDLHTKPWTDIPSSVFEGLEEEHRVILRRRLIDS